MEMDPPGSGSRRQSKGLLQIRVQLRRGGTGLVEESGFGKRGKGPRHLLTVPGLSRETCLQRRGDLDLPDGDSALPVNSQRLPLRFKHHRTVADVVADADRIENCRRYFRIATTQVFPEKLRDVRGPVQTAARLRFDRQPDPFASPLKNCFRLPCPFLQLPGTTAEKIRLLPLSPAEWEGGDRAAILAVQQTGEDAGQSPGVFQSRRFGPCRMIDCVLDNVPVKIAHGKTVQRPDGKAASRNPVPQSRDLLRGRRQLGCDGFVQPKSAAHRSAAAGQFANQSHPVFEIPADFREGIAGVHVGAVSNRVGHRSFAFQSLTGPGGGDRQSDPAGDPEASSKRDQRHHPALVQQHPRQEESRKQQAAEEKQNAGRTAPPRPPERRDGNQDQPKGMHDHPEYSRVPGFQSPDTVWIPLWQSRLQSVCAQSAGPHSDSSQQGASHKKQSVHGHLTPVQDGMPGRDNGVPEATCDRNRDRLALNRLRWRDDGKSRDKCKIMVASSGFSVGSTATHRSLSFGRGAVFALCLLFAGLSATGQETGKNSDPVPDSLPTVAEASNYEATSLSGEVNDFLAACDQRGGHVVRLEFGRTAKDQPMYAALIANPPLETVPADGRSAGPADGRLVVLLLGNIHSGECDGKEALLRLARELTLDPDHAWLKKAVLLIVPNYNADANDEVAVNNRPGQIGPAAGMGKRETSQGFDLNRDFMKLDSPEARALVRLIDTWNPHLFIDCHTTNGSRHRYQLTYDVPHNPASPTPLRKFLRERMIPDVTTQMKSAGFDSFYYGNFNRDQTRWDTYGFEPRYSVEYLGLRGRIGILSESYSYIGYRERILATHAFVTACVGFVCEHHEAVAGLLREIDAQWLEATATNPSHFDLPLDAVIDRFDQPARILAWEGRTDTPRDVDVEFWGNYREASRTSLPYAYLIPAGFPRVIENLKAHGIRMDTTSAAWECDVQFQTIQAIRRSPQQFQGHAMVRLQTNMGRDSRKLPAGMTLVRTSQPLGRVAVWLLEPQSAEGLVTWNYFDDHLEQGSEFPVLRIENPQEIPVEPALSGAGE